MKLFVGTSGYSYKQWKGAFYPPGLPANQMLRFYAQHFPAVESNDTFYRMPTPSALEARAGQVPAGFRFVLKAPKEITHARRLRDSGESMSRFLDAAAVLKRHLGPLLFQLPPNFRKDVERLRQFLTLLPSERRAAFEFRHASWFDDEVLSVLREHRTALCLADAEDDLEVPFVATTDWGYLRLRRADYTDAELKAWLRRVQKQDWREAYVFFRHEDQGNGPRMAKRLLELAGWTRSGRRFGQEGFRVE